MNRAYLLANFGGPRNLKEISGFLQELLCDKDVVRTRLPQIFHSLFFRNIAKKRALKVACQYKKIGGLSPIFQDTEDYKEMLASKLDGPVVTFHRYLPATHEKSIQELKTLEFDELRVLPLFPQFTYATTGSIARFLQKRLPDALLQKTRWIKSFPAHPAFIFAHQQKIMAFLEEHQLDETQVFFIFSAHGIPEIFLKDQDLYRDECLLSFDAIMQAFPNGAGLLSFQSKFGPGEWIKPYTENISKNILKFNQNRKHILFIPLSFISDHVETLFEIEEEYLPPIRDAGLRAYRVPALNKDPLWIDAMGELFQSKDLCNTKMLIRKP